ncbi:MAG: hypothetical protein HGB35_07005 [Geobacteraceae bacterium]|nr:hypothetical protein [Geobacteraceae bacterium]
MEKKVSILILLISITISAVSFGAETEGLLESTERMIDGLIKQIETQKEGGIPDSVSQKKITDYTGPVYIPKADNTQGFRLISGYLKSDSSLRSIEDSKKYKQISEFALLPVSCIYSLYGDPKYYEVMYCGKGYVVKEGDIAITKDENTYLHALDHGRVDLMRENAKKVSIYFRIGDYERGIALGKKLHTRGLFIYDREIYDTSEYSEGTGFKVSIFNTSNKTIKYISFSVIGYNPVKDMVRGRPVVKGVGPIKPGESAVYDWEYLWFTDLVQTHKIMQIKVQYMDGSVKVYKSGDDLILSGYEKYLISVLGDADTKEVIEGIAGDKK